MKKYDSHVLRRAEFLLGEARSGFTKRDLAITMVLRAISNYVTVGLDGSSHKVKKTNLRMSQAALELKNNFLLSNGIRRRRTNISGH